MKTRTLYRDMTTGLFLIAGVYAFVSGQFIFSILLLGMASLVSNLQTAAAVRI